MTLADSLDLIVDLIGIVASFFALLHDNMKSDCWIFKAVEIRQAMHNTAIDCNIAL